MTNVQNNKWKAIAGWEGYYEIDAYSNIKSLKRVIKRKAYGDLLIKEKILATKIDRYGYVVATLTRNNKCYSHTVHTLNAKVFIPNPDNLPQVNHKDGNKLNNHTDNLEWSTGLNNLIHARVVLGVKARYGVPILQLQMTGELYKEWPTLSSAIKAGYGKKEIYAVIKGKQNHHKGYKWKFKE